MKKQRIRPIAIGVFIHDGRILVLEGWDSVKQKAFFRPLGGGIKFGEKGADALKREMLEEIGQEITEPEYLGTIESIFTCEGLPGHEIVQVYSAGFRNRDVYMASEIEGHEDDGSVIHVRWMELDYFRGNPGLLVPEELMGLLGI